MRLQPHQLAALRQWESMREPRADFVMPPPKKRKKRGNEESKMQRALITWWRREAALLGVPEMALLSIPNGGGRSGPVAGSILKAEGLRKGAPDLFLAVPYSCPTVKGGGYHGLFVELKRPGGVLSSEQEEFHAMLSHQGYKVVVCWSFLGAIREIKDYLNP